MNNLFPTTPAPKLPESTYFQDLYAVFIEEQLDTVRYYQDWISLLIGLKETSEYNSEAWQRCGVYLIEDKIYLERAVRELGNLRRTAEGGRNEDKETKV